VPVLVGARASKLARNVQGMEVQGHWDISQPTKRNLLTWLDGVGVGWGDGSGVGWMNCRGMRTQRSFFWRVIFCFLKDSSFDVC
jgi:hypothetical protein